MSHTQMTKIEFREILKKAADEQITAVMSHLCKGKWHMTKVAITALTPNALHVDVSISENHRSGSIRIDQPVGMSVEAGSSKYIFETTVTGMESSVNDAGEGKIILNLPDRVEKMQRRADARASVPDSLNVKVLFWHRGYADETIAMPMENYWQGSLIDISAVGLRMAVDLDQEPNFRTGQFIDLQFTPMPYEKPLHLEGQVRHVAKTDDGQSVSLGIQVIGLEATRMGRQKLQRMHNIVADYQKAGGARTQENFHSDHSEEASCEDTSVSGPRLDKQCDEAEVVEEFIADQDQVAVCVQDETLTENI